MKMTRFLILCAGLALFCPSCAKQDTQAAKPVELPAKKATTTTSSVKSKPKATPEEATKSTADKAMPKPAAKPSPQPAPVSQANDTEQVEKAQAPISVKAASLFRTPADINLPTDAEIAEGQNASGSKKPAGKPDNAPSISVKPSAPVTGSD